MTQPYWTVERDREVTLYLIGLREAGGAIRAAINQLHNGIPADAKQKQDEPNTWEWVEARHWITFVADVERQWIYVSVVESATIE